MRSLARSSALGRPPPSLCPSTLRPCRPAAPPRYKSLVLNHQNPDPSRTTIHTLGARPNEEEGLEVSSVGTDAEAANCPPG
jgi:hypothetical protein